MPENLPLLPEDEERLQQELENMRIHPKLALWAKYFLDRTNKDTYGNRTQSAIKAYNLDPIEQYASAGVMGSENFKKLRIVTNLYLEQNGMTTAKVIDLIVAHAVAKGGKALEMLASIMNIYDPKMILVSQQTNITVNNGDVTKEEAKKFNQDWEKFVDSQYATPKETLGSGG